MKNSKFNGKKNTLETSHFVGDFNFDLDCNQCFHGNSHSTFVLKQINQDSFGLSGTGDYFKSQVVQFTKITSNNHHYT